MNLTAALEIQGFTNERELEWLAQQAAISKTIVEIGSWKGRSTRAMADNLQKGSVIYAVDTWKGTAEDSHMEQLVGKPEEWLMGQFLSNMGPELLGTGAVVPVQAPSTEAALRFANGPKFDFIFIDAAHDYDNVKADILAWRPLLASGGLLAGHDFVQGRGGVVRAVCHTVKKPRALGIGSIWIAE